MKCQSPAAYTEFKCGSVLKPPLLLTGHLIIHVSIHRCLSLRRSVRGQMYKHGYNIKSSRKLFCHDSMTISNLALIIFFLALKLQHHQDLFKMKVGLVKEFSELYAASSKVKGKRACTKLHHTSIYVLPFIRQTNKKTTRKETNTLWFVAFFFFFFSFLLCLGLLCFNLIHNRVLDIFISCMSYCNLFL